MAIKDTLVIKTFEELRSDYLTTFREGLINRGVVNPNVSDGTEAFVRGTALATVLAPIAAQIGSIPDAMMPDTSTGEDLLRQAASYGVVPKTAGPSAGAVVAEISVAIPVGIVAGSQLIDSTGQSYQVSVSGPYSDGDLIPIESVSVGSSTNLPAGSVLRWSAPPALVLPSAVVATGGLTGGADTESEEAVRSRWLDKLANPPNGANASTWIGVAEQSHPSVQKAFCYQAANGPATLHIAVTAAPTATNRERDVPTTFMTNTIKPVVEAAIQAGVAVVTTTVANVPVDISIGLALPASPASQPPGPGGGWIDGQPWPVLAVPGFVQVQAVTSSIEFTANSDYPPVIGTRVSWLSPNDWILRTASVVGIAGLGPYTVTIDTPFVDTTSTVIAVGDYLFPASERGDYYVSALLDHMGRMGPGQMTTSPGLLPRAYRVPAIQQSWPADLNRQLIRALIDAGDEVDDADYFYRSALTPGLPATISDPPKILVPRRIGFYPLT